MLDGESGGVLDRAGVMPDAGGVTGTTTRARVLLEQMRELLAALDSGELSGGPAYRHRTEGAITALEAVLGLPPSLDAGVPVGVRGPSA